MDEPTSEQLAQTLCPLKTHGCTRSCALFSTDTSECMLRTIATDLLGLIYRVNQEMNRRGFDE